MNLCAAPYDMPRTLRTRRQKQLTLTAWSPADQLARKAAIDQ
jgi:hypothetical protein